MGLSNAPPFHGIQPSFAAGEITPALWARIDIQKYATGCRTLRNFSVLPQGGVRNRPGTAMVAVAGVSANPVRLIPFVFSDGQAFILEFGHQYIRFYTQDAQILSGGNPYQISSPYSGSDLFLLNVAQSADTLYIDHPSYAPQQLTRITNSSWTLTAYNFTGGPFMLKNTDTAKKISANALTGAVTLTASGFTPFVAGHIGALWELNHPVESQVQNYVRTFGGPFIAPAAIECAHVYRITTTGDWQGTLTIEKSLDGGTVWTPVRHFTQTTLQSNFESSGDTGEDQCLLRITTILTAGTISAQLSGESFTWHGIVKITGFTSSTVVTGTVQTVLGGTAADVVDMTDWSEGSWSTYRGFPSCVEFYLDRQCHAATPTEPQTVWMSQVADYTNFSVSHPIVDSDAISVVLVSRTVNIVKHLKVLSNNLLALTSDTDFSIGPGSTGALTPTSLEVQSHGHRGASSVDPVIVGNEMIIIQPMSSVARNLIFQFAVQGYMGDNLSVISQHLFTGFTIAQMAYAQEPDSIVWMIRSDGTLLSFTYIREQEMASWAHHDTNGLFESVAVIPNTTLGINEVWVVVNRSGTRYIERMYPREQGVVPADQQFMDCSRTYTGAPATVISGLDHLNGRQVAILADGNVIANPNDPQYPVFTVAGNSITLPVAASKVIVGLPYICDLETLRVEYPQQDGTTQGRRMKIPRGKIRFWNSRGGWFRALGNSSDPVSLTSLAGFDAIKQREPGDNLNAPIALKTRDYPITFAGGYDHGAHLFFRQTDPLPVCVLAFMPLVIVGGE